MHSYLSGLFGGSLIGLSASVLLLFAGEILGASGIVSSVFLAPLQALRDPCQHWKLVLIASFSLIAYLFFAPPEYSDKDNGLASLSPAAFAIGGLLVGFGTRLGNGCTSGHGICGLARFSKRSFVAVGTFMTTGILTAYLTQASTSPFPEKTKFLRNEGDSPIRYYDIAASVIVMLLALVALVAPTLHHDPDSNCRAKLGPAAAAGVLFSSGLYVSQMVYPSVVLGFLNLGLIPKGEWNPTLMFVMGGGVAVSFLSYQFVERFRVLKCVRPLSRPLALSSGSDFSVPTNSAIDMELVIGALCFGLGWGISGLCPGPAMFLASIGVSWVLVCYWPAFFLGSFLAEKIKRYRRNKESDASVSDVDVDVNCYKQETTDSLTNYGSTREKQ